MLLLILFALMLFLMLSRVISPVPAKTSGRVTAKVSLSFQERVLMQRVNVYSIAAVTLLTVVTGVLPRGWELPVVVLALGVLMLPVSVVLTTDGIAINNVVFRPWTDFTGYRVEKRRIVLLPMEGVRPFVLPVMAGKHVEAERALKARLRIASEPAGRDRQVKRAATQSR